ncbi:MAG: hypothetical protein E7661_07910 [Ruminococcaceae bacterium]|nr:hypothetical protein [Oscillospiraceae bacterium]
MKRIIALVALVAMIASLFVVPTSAAVEGMINEGGHWVVNSPKHAEIVAGEAGEVTTAWEVPWLKISPTLDGKIGKGEYLPFEMYEDYLAYMAIATGNTEADFEEFYELTRYGFFDAYWGWDGVYMYLAFEVDTVNGHTCTPEVEGSTAYLYAYNMLQVGIAPTDSTGRGYGNKYVELGYGVHSETGESLAHAWMGPYKPVSNEDFVGSYDKDNQKVVYEVRIHLQTALGLTDTVVENGDQINYAWLLSVNGEETSVDNYWQVGFCHGIGGQYSNKMTQYFACVTFDGKPDDVEIKPEEIPGVSEEDLTYGLAEYVNMGEEKVVNGFITEDCYIELTTEGDETFARIFAAGDNPYLWSKEYPRALRADLGSYAVVKYRTSSAKAGELGHIYRSARVPEYDFDWVYTEDLETDGHWRYVIFDMGLEENWRDWIANIGFVPFYEETDCAGEYIDIAWVKYYEQEPYDLYESEEEIDTEPVVEPETDAEVGTDEATVDTSVEEGVTAAPVEDGTDAPAEDGTKAPAEDDTKAPAEESTKAPATAETKAPASAETKAEAKTEAAGTTVEGDGTTAGTDATTEGGCASVMASVGVLLSAAAAAVVLKKKD